MSDKYVVRVRAECEMLVGVEADSHEEAKQKARVRDYSPLSNWEQARTARLRAPNAWKREWSEEDE